MKRFTCNAHETLLKRFMKANNVHIMDRRMLRCYRITPSHYSNNEKKNEEIDNENKNFAKMLKDVDKINDPKERLNRYIDGFVIPAGGDEKHGYKFNPSNFKDLEPSFENQKLVSKVSKGVMSSEYFKKETDYLGKTRDDFTFKRHKDLQDIITRGIVATTDSDAEILKNMKNMKDSTEKESVAKSLDNVRLFIPSPRAPGEQNTIEDVLRQRGQSIEHLSDFKYKSRDDVLARLREDIPEKEKRELNDLLQLEEALKATIDPNSLNSTNYGGKGKTNWKLFWAGLLVALWFGGYVLFTLSDANRLLVYEPARNRLFELFGMEPPESSQVKITQKLKTRWKKVVAHDENGKPYYKYVKYIQKDDPLNGNEEILD